MPLFDEITRHPFVEGLTRGTLSAERFNHFLSQDILYIAQDSRALAAAASVAPHNDQMLFLLDMARDGLQIERELHNHYLSHFNTVAAQEMSPVVEAYSNFLLARAHGGDYATALAALLPCFWVYLETGLLMLEQSAENNPYQLWLNTYAGDEFKEYTRRFIDITEQAAAVSSPATHEAMTQAFMQSTQYELLFFTEAWERE